jgi:4-hydroxy-3-methylbut-2-enyl diphosphate reductase
MWIEGLAVRSALRGGEVVGCGVGRKRALRFVAAFAKQRSAPRALAVAGVCGSLHPWLVPGDVVVATELVDSAGRRQLDSAKPLARALEARGLKVTLGAILSLDHLGTRAERESQRATGAIAVDMESAWLASLADSAPFAVLRVVSDGPDHELFSPHIVANGIRALRALRAATPALETWATTATHSTH